MTWILTCLFQIGKGQICVRPAFHLIKVTRTNKWLAGKWWEQFCCLCTATLVSWAAALWPHASRGAALSTVSQMRRSRSCWDLTSSQQSQEKAVVFKQLMALLHCSFWYTSPGLALVQEPFKEQCTTCTVDQWLQREICSVTQIYQLNLHPANAQSWPLTQHCTPGTTG